MKYKQFLVDHGATIIAPCPHQNACPLPENDWCNFEVRVERSRIHKAIKDADSPFEDEKFIYLLAAKETNINNKINENAISSNYSRVLRHPIISKGYVELKICSADGIRMQKITKKQGEIYKTAKKISAGDEINIKYDAYKNDIGYLAEIDPA